MTFLCIVLILIIIFLGFLIQIKDINKPVWHCTLYELPPPGIWVLGTYNPHHMWGGAFTRIWRMVTPSDWRLQHQEGIPTAPPYYWAYLPKMEIKRDY